MNSAHRFSGKALTSPASRADRPARRAATCPSTIMSFRAEADQELCKNASLQGRCAAGVQYPAQRRNCDLDPRLGCRSPRQRRRLLREESRLVRRWKLRCNMADQRRRPQHRGELAPSSRRQVVGRRMAATGGRWVAGIRRAEQRGRRFGLARWAAGPRLSGRDVLPPYFYPTDWREMKAHVAAVLAGDAASACLYNIPFALQTDFLPHNRRVWPRSIRTNRGQGSSADVRRSAAPARRPGRALAYPVGVDDMIVEGVACPGGSAGLSGWSMLSRRIGGTVPCRPRGPSAALFSCMLGSPPLLAPWTWCPSSMHKRL